MKKENEKLSVFQPGGPYLATKKIGKNNPKAEQIKTDNYLRQEWNQMVDRAKVPKGFFHKKERRELEDKISAKTLQLEKAKTSLVAIPAMHGFENVSEFKKAFKQAKADLAAVQALQEEWKRPDPKPEKWYYVIPSNVKRAPVREDKSIKARLEEKKVVVKELEQARKPKKKSRDRDCL